MAYGAYAGAAENGPVCVRAEWGFPPAPSRLALQHAAAPGCCRTSGLALDVAGAFGVLFPAASRKHRPRRLWRNARARGHRFRSSGQIQRSRFGRMALHALGGSAQRSENEQPRVVVAVVRLGGAEPEAALAAPARDSGSGGGGGGSVVFAYGSLELSLRAGLERRRGRDAG